MKSNRTPNSLKALLGILGLIFFLAPIACTGSSKADKLHEQGMLFFKHRKYYDAIEKFEQALDLQPERTGTLVHLAEAYLNTDKPEQAIVHAQTALDRKPELNSAYLVIGQAHLDLALENRETDEAGKIRLDQQHLDRAAEIAAQLRQAEPDSIEGMLLQARIDFLNRRFESAERLYREVVDREPKNMTARLGLGDALITLREFDEALEIAQESVKLSQEAAETPNPMAIAQVANSLMQQGNYNAAYEYLEPYVQDETENPNWALFLMARDVLLRQAALLEQQGQDELLTAVIDEATTPTQDVQIDRDELINRMASLGSTMKGFFPNHPESWFVRAVSYELMGKQKEFIDHLEEAASRGQGLKRYRMALAMAYIREGKYTQAREELSNVLKTNPGDLDARMRMAQIMLIEGRPEDARETLRNLYLESPGNQQIRELYGRVLALSEDPADVEKGLQLLAAGGGTTDHAYVRAEATLNEARRLYRQQQVSQAAEKFDEAEKQFHHILEENPSNYRAALRLSQLLVLRNDLMQALRYAKHAAEIEPQFLPRLAMLYSQLGQPRAAADIYRRLLEQSPQALGFALSLANLEAQIGQVDQAGARLENLIEANPENPQPVMVRAQLHYQQGELEEAIQYLEAKQATLGDEPQVSLLLARYHLVAENTQRAIDLLKQAAETQNSRLTLMRAGNAPQSEIDEASEILTLIYLELALGELIHGNPDQTLQYTEMVLDLNESLQPAIQVLRSIAYLAQDDPTQALALLDTLLDEAQNVGYLPLIKSLTHLKAAQTQQALEAVADEESLNENLMVLYRKMIERFDAGQLSDVADELAIQIYLGQSTVYAPLIISLTRQTLDQLPDSPYLLARIAESQQTLGNLEAALDSYDRIEQLMPEYIPPYLAQFDLQQSLGRMAELKGNQEEAQAHYNQAFSIAEEALQVEPENTEMLENKALLHLRMDQIDQSNELFRKLIEIDPDNWSAYNNLAWNLAQSGQIDEALEVGRKALELAPNHPGIQDTVGWAELKAGNTTIALKLFEDAVVVAPNNPEIRFHYAQALLAADRTDEGIEQLQTILLAAPGYDHIEEVRSFLEQYQPEAEILQDDAATTR